ncbi:MAG: nucleotide exchange factor GrpE [Treponemataceae bacterium]|nr:nucleotide exchange factor GrpE [Treponemataceae bacterium]
MEEEKLNTQEEENKAETVSDIKESVSDDVGKTEKSETMEKENTAETTEDVTQEPTPEQKVEELEKEVAELKDQYLRKCADFENYRKRMFREKQEAFDYANTNLLTDLIAVLDDFDRALAAGVTPEGEPVADLKPVVDGIKIINKQMRGLLEAKYNLSVYGEKGDLFNHDLHEAIATNQGPVAEPVCTEVYLKGYKLKDRVIRPAKVMVQMPDGSVGSEEAPESEN